MTPAAPSSFPPGGSEWLPVIFDDSPDAQVMPLIKRSRGKKRGAEGRRSGLFLRSPNADPYMARWKRLFKFYGNSFQSWLSCKRSLLQITITITITINIRPFPYFATPFYTDPCQWAPCPCGDMVKISYKLSCTLERCQKINKDPDGKPIAPLSRLFVPFPRTDSTFYPLAYLFLQNFSLGAPLSKVPGEK